MTDFDIKLRESSKVVLDCIRNFAVVGTIGYFADNSKSISVIILFFVAQVALLINLTSYIDISGLDFKLLKSKNWRTISKFLISFGFLAFTVLYWTFKIPSIVKDIVGVQAGLKAGSVEAKVPNCKFSLDLTGYKCL